MTIMGSVMFLLPITLLVFGSVVSYDWSSITNLRKLWVPSNNAMDDRIVGGKRAWIEDHPYQVSITVNKSGNICGGFIVSENYIVTAAHCVQNATLPNLLVRAGSSEWKNGGTIIKLAEKMFHPGYYNPPFDKDVGILKTAEPIVYSNVIQPIKMAVKGRRMIANTMASVSGWGKTTFGATKPTKHLRNVSYPVVDHGLCSRVYPTVTENQWCGGDFFFGNKAACLGDSGGAAVQDGIAVGVVSYSLYCGLPGLPTSYTDIAAPSIRDYITKHTGL